MWVHCAQMLLPLRKNGQEESRLLNLRRLRSSSLISQNSSRFLLCEMSCETQPDLSSEERKEFVQWHLCSRFAALGGETGWSVHDGWLSSRATDLRLLHKLIPQNDIVMICNPKS